MEVLANLAPSLHTITSYTGDEVDVMGTFSTDIKIGQITLKNCHFYVSRDNRRTIIGTPAIKANKIVINLAEHNIKQGDHTEHLEHTTENSGISTSELGKTSDRKNARISEELHFRVPERRF